ncbi:hypothetical protein QVD17_30238 [Tagetes erecta]|uniref:Uncharacterized protein n=1 Tax=Tagetes erecta TaxID=13708 RepID=A0AAD8K597_TARER|nr:hypothetical protein QVD17_30238 [Tagetes erecta]
MACLNVQVKNENQGGFMDPRISFSNDFIDSNHHEHQSYNEAPVSSDFEFSLPTFSSNSADEVFFKGKVTPLKEKVVTLRDELRAGHDDNDGMIINKNSTGWWKEKFGLRKIQNGKTDIKNLGGLETIDEAKTKPTFYGSSFTGNK